MSHCLFCSLDLMREIMGGLTFSDWLIVLGMVPFRPIPAVAGGGISFFFTELLSNVQMSLIGF